MKSNNVALLIKLAERQGWTVTRTGKKHLKFSPPEGTPVIVAGTPSDYRSFRNVKREFNKRGLKVNL